MASEGKITTKSVLTRAAGLLRPGRLTGPIFEKELRVSARRRRNYVLRSVYLAMLTILIALVWMSQVGRSYYYRSLAQQISQMSEVGKIVIMSITWFQCCMLQLIAVIMLSTAISDEIYHRTLGVLMTTPINSFQIIMGKLFSKLWQLLILLAVSLPVLAIVRVFGGVPLEFVVSGLCITLTGVIFAGSVSMYFSIRSRRAYVVILKTLITGGVLYALLPFLFFVLLEDFYRDRDLWPIVLHPNPFGALVWTTDEMLRPAGMRPVFSWPLHCAIMLGASAAVLTMCVSVVRKVALRQATGQAGVFTKRKWRRIRKSKDVHPIARDAPAGRIRRITGPPVVWKELKNPLIRGGKITVVIAAAAIIAALVITYLICDHNHALDDEDTHIAYTLIFVGIGMLVTAVLSATTITSEKESRSWPILLATTLSDWQILTGKAVGVIRKCLPVWGLLALHITIFTFAGIIHPIALWHLAMLVAWLVVFFTGAGLYFSARFRRTTTAVVMSISLALVLWLIIPAVAGLVTEIVDPGDYDAVEYVLSANPLIQAGTVIDGAAGHQYRTAWDRNYPFQLRYHWPDNDCDTVWETTARMLNWTLAYMLAGVVFALLAKRRLRRTIF